MKKILLLTALSALVFASCKKKDKDEDPVQPQTAPRLIFKFKFDSTQVRLNNFGQPAALPSDHRGQSPKFNKMSGHYIEMTSNDHTAVGGGVVLYRAPEVTTGGATAIDFNQSVRVGQDQEFFSVPLSSVAAGTYKWLRVSLAYQNYDITYKNSLIPGNGLGTGTIASFIGFKTYITNYTIKTQVETINANRLQGYWGFETTVFGTTYKTTGQAPATTVVNPNPDPNAAIPPGSCLVTAQFVAANGSNSPLIITGNETKDITVTVSLSTNKSFEWVEHGGDNYYEPVNASNPSVQDTVVDMGIRGMIPKWE
ncbi:MAG: hypothetical protein K0S33_3024 [Bacteroidetes bacterium]|jgi:hypothetical protein|nr:hypothetical protein [Bacteroidota bacterium]